MNRVANYILSICTLVVIIVLTNEFSYEFEDIRLVFLIALIMASTIAILRSIEYEVEV